MTKRGTPVAKRAQVAERRTAAIALRAEGRSWDEIAAQLGYKTRGAACQDVSRALEVRLQEQNDQIDHLRAIELERLDAMEREVWVVLRARHVKVSGANIVREDGEDGEPGEPLIDDAPVLAAVDRLNRISERRSKLLGLDAPAHVEHDGQVTVRYQIDGVDLGALS